MSEDALRQLEEFFSQYKVRNYRKHDIIIHEDDVPTGVYFIQKGYVRLYSVSRHGEEITRLIMGPSELFPLRWAIAHDPIDYYAEPMCDVSAVYAPKEVFLQFIMSNPQILLAVTSKIVKRMGSLYRRMEYLAFGNAYEKVASVLAAYARRYGQQEENRLVIPIPFTHKDIGSLVGLTRETVSLEIEKLERKGLINTHNHLRIIINDLSALEQESLLGSV